METNVDNIMQLLNLLKVDNGDVLSKIKNKIGSEEKGGNEELEN